MNSILDLFRFCCVFIVCLMFRFCLLVRFVFGFGVFLFSVLICFVHVGLNWLSCS